MRKGFWLAGCALVLLAVAGVWYWHWKANESASPEVRRLAAVRPFSLPANQAPPETPVQPPATTPAPPPPAGFTALTAIRDDPASYAGKEVTVLATVESALYGAGINDCAFTYRVTDGASRAWVLPISRPTPAIGKTVRLRATVVLEPDRPWSDDRTDAFYLKEVQWAEGKGSDKPGR